MLNKLVNTINSKAVLIVLIAFLSMSVYPINDISEEATAEEAASTPSKRVRSKIVEINAQIENDAKEIRKLNEDNNIYIALGLTQEGKSTLINFLGGKRLTAKKSIGTNIMVVEKPFKGIEDGDDLTSKTSVPAYWYDEEKIIYYDAPGFSDTGSATFTKEEADVINAYSIFKLFDKLPRDRIKIMLVVAESSIVSTGAGIKTTINTMGKFFENNLKDVASGTCVVVTKQEKLTESEVREKFKLFLTMPGGAFTKESLPFLKELASNSQIVFFPKPKEDELSKSLEGVRWDAAKTTINAALANTANLKQEIIPTISVSDKAREYIPVLTKDEFENIKDFITKEVVEGIKKHCQGKIAATQTNPKELRAYFTDLSVQLKNLDVADLDRFMQGMHDVLVEKCKRADLYNEIKKSVDDILFFKMLNEDMVFPLKDLVDALSETQKYLAELGEAPKKITPSDDVLQIVGLLVGTSDIPDSLIKTGIFNGREGIKRIDLYGLNTLWLDANITSHGKENENGLSFSFIAPNWRIINKVTIDLSGEDGSVGGNGVNGDKPGAPGSNGAPGRPGGNGGHFYGKGIDFGSSEQLRLLTINTSGGRGGNGGNGGDGADGKKGKDGDLSKENRFYYTHDIIYTYEDVGEAGSDGGNAGQGGIKGISGYNGIAVIDGGATADWYHYSDKSDGISGRHGKVGKKGEHGQDCAGRRWWNHNDEKEASEGHPRHVPSSKPPLADGQPATALNAGQTDQKPQAPSLLDKDTGKLVSGYNRYNFYAEKYKGNPFTVKCDV